MPLVRLLPHLRSRKRGKTSEGNAACFVSLNDVIIISKTLLEHLDLLRVIFDLLEELGLMVQVENRIICSNKVDLIGRIIFNGGVKTDQMKIRAFSDNPIPK